MTILEQINGQFPIRRSDEQKAAFRQWVMGEMTRMGYRPRVEENGKHHNVVCGSPDGERITITAHYDTPACIGLPNLMIPRNFAVYALYQAMIVLILLSIAFAAGFGLMALTGSEVMLRVGLLGAYLLLLGFMLYGPANKHNVNDNTSGVAALLQTMAQIPEEHRQKVAFILFDNEEKGCRGSKAYAKEHLAVMHTRLIVNLDCVGVGEHFLLSVPSLAKNMEEYQLLERVLAEQPGRTVHFFSALTTRGNSDFRSFKCGVGVSAYRRVAGVGFCTGAIHTSRDTRADEGNIAFIADGLAACVGQLEERG
ncbi:MAG: M28 family peptidase [Clostridia bacterium]|nr:M28 family peptidase [Clostridia bacterium]